MQQLPCGCRRLGRRNCIEPSCPFESELSKNELYFCPFARERNARRTGEPELCPVELPAVTYTSIVHTGRCIKHRREMEGNLLRQKRREEKEKEKRREEERDWGEKEVEMRREKGLESIGEESPERVVEDGDGNEKGKGVGQEKGDGDGSGNGTDNTARDGNEKGDGLMPGMNANEKMHVKAVLAHRDRARLEVLRAETAADAINETKVVAKESQEPTKAKGKQKEDDRKMTRNQTDEKDKNNEENTAKQNPPSTSAPFLPPIPKGKDPKSLHKELFRKKYTGLDESTLEKVKVATASLSQMIANDWEENVRQRGAGVAEARKVSQTSKVSETLKMFEKKTQLDVSSLVAGTKTGRVSSGELNTGYSVSSGPVPPRSYTRPETPPAPPPVLLEGIDDPDNWRDVRPMVDEDEKGKYLKTRNEVVNPPSGNVSGDLVTKDPAVGGGCV